MDGLIDNIRRVLRGETAGSVRFVGVLLCMLIVWVSVLTVYGWNVSAQSALSSQQGRLGTLLMLADEYKTLSPKATGNRAQNVDVAAVFAQVTENMQLGGRVSRITPDGHNQSVEINRLYAEELIELQKQLVSRGVRFIAAELRAMPTGRERLMTVSAVIGPIS